MRTQTPPPPQPSASADRGSALPEKQKGIGSRENYFRMLIEHATGIVAIVDVEAAIRYLSPAVERVLGYTPAALIGHRLPELTHNEDLPLLRDLLDHARRKRDLTGAVELRLQHADGSWRFLEVAGNRMPDEAGAGGVVINAHDVTERKVAEEALAESQLQLHQSQKMEAVGRLAGGVAHDFNNMLTAIKGFSQLMRMELSENDPLHEYVEEIDRAADRSAALTRQLLTFSRRQVVQPRVLELNTVVTGMEPMLRRLIGEDVRLAFRLDSELPPVLADPGQMEQVVLNLVVNARDAMPRGGSMVVATLTEPNDAGGSPVSAVLSVEDSGCGMDESTRARIFEPFFTTKGAAQGTGLGLSTVYGIVQQSGGEIQVQSEIGRGTIFRIVLPGAASSMIPAASTESHHVDVHTAATVLLVEDEPVVRALARRLLEQIGHRVIEAGSGAEALLLHRQHADEIDLLLTDVVMPGISGPELAAHLGSRHPGLRTLFLSGYSAEVIGQHIELAPELPLLQKPFSRESLAEAVHTALGAA